MRLYSGPLRTRLLILLLGLSLPALLILQFLAFTIIGGLVRDRMTDRLRAEARLLADLLLRDGSFVPEADRIADRYGKTLGVRVTAIKTNGRVVADSARDGADLAAMENHRNRPEVVAAMEGGEGVSRRSSSTTGLEMLYFAWRVEERGRTDGIVRVAVRADEVDALVAAPSRYILVGGLATCLAVIILSWLLARQTGASLESLAGVVEALAEGDARDPDPGVFSFREVRRIDRFLRRVRGRLKEQVADVASERNRLRAILEGMREGILFVDAKDSIVLANPAAAALFPDLARPLEGRSVIDLARDPDVLDLFRRAMTDGSSGTTKMARSDGRILEVRVVPVEGPGILLHGAMALFLDVTQLERLESVRRDFVANVSHELRTPLTSIKSFTETLLRDPASEEAREFLEIVARNVERMEALVNDLTDLSLIETGAISLKLETCPVTRPVREAIELLSARAAERDVTIGEDLPGEIAIRADPRLMTQAVVNLLDNAIKWSPEGATVTIGAEVQEGGVAILVADEGPGIPDAEREQIFQRFHRVPDREEKKGTGLGLAIVKHLARIQGGTVEVEANPGGGSLFRLVIPIAC